MQNGPRLRKVRAVKILRSAGLEGSPHLPDVVNNYKDEKEKLDYPGEIERGWEGSRNHTRQPLTAAGGQGARWGLAQHGRGLLAYLQCLSRKIYTKFPRERAPMCSHR